MAVHVSVERQQSLLDEAERGERCDGLRDRAGLEQRVRRQAVGLDASDLEPLDDGDAYPGHASISGNSRRRISGEGSSQSTPARAPAQPIQSVVRRPIQAPRSPPTSDPIGRTP